MTMSSRTASDCSSKRHPPVFVVQGNMMLLVHTWSTCPFVPVLNTLKSTDSLKASMRKLEPRCSLLLTNVFVDTLRPSILSVPSYPWLLLLTIVIICCIVANINVKYYLEVFFRYTLWSSLLNRVTRCIGLCIDLCPRQNRCSLNHHQQGSIAARRALQYRPVLRSAVVRDLDYQRPLQVTKIPFSGFDACTLLSLSM